MPTVTSTASLSIETLSEIRSTKQFFADTLVPVTTTQRIQGEVLLAVFVCFQVPAWAIGVILGLWDIFEIRQLLKDTFADMWNVQQSLSVAGLEETFDVIEALQGIQFVDSFVVVPEQFEALLGPGASDIQLPFVTVTKEA